MNAIRSCVERVLGRHLPAIVAQGLVGRLPASADLPPGTLDVLELCILLHHVEGGLKLFGAKTPRTILDDLRTSIVDGRPPAPRVEVVPVMGDGDVLEVQRRCRSMVQRVFGPTDAVRLVTAVSELARNIYLYAGVGEVELALAEVERGIRFSLIARDNGPGIPNLDDIMAGRYVSKTGLGRGIRGTKALLDEMSVETALGKGTVVRGHRMVRR